MFYHFSQNNSGGDYVVDNNVKENVIIEADSPAEANNIAKTVGIYFDGVTKGEDCPCCGDRWSPLWSHEKGDDVPKVFSQEVDDSTAGVIIYRKDK